MNDPMARRKNERKSVIYVMLILITVSLLAAVIIIWKLKCFDSDDICTTRECVKLSFFLLDILDTDVPPCDNFYNFTCGNYKGHLLIHNHQQRINRFVKNFTVNHIEDNDTKSVKLQKKYYQACMNLTVIEEDQNETLKKLFEELGGWPVLKGTKWNESEFDWGKIVEKCKDIGFYYDWFVNINNVDETVYENRLYITIPDNTNTVEDSVKKNYVALMTNVAIILDAPGNLTNIAESMSRVMEFEIGLSKIIQNSQVNTTNQEYTIEDIKYQYPNMPWSSLFKYVILPRNSKVLFSLDAYIPQLEEYLNKTDKRVQADYIFWKLTESFSAFLTYAIREEFETYADSSKNYRFVRDREKYCYGITSNVFAYVSEGEFVRNCTIKKESIKEMVDRISLVLRNHIDNAKWMTEVKELSFNKINSMKVIIGGPDEMYNEDEFNKVLGIDEIHLLGLKNTIEIILEVDKRRELFNLDFSKPKLNVKQAQMYQGVTNLGYIKYMPDENIVFLPAATLDGIFYSQRRPNYLNYGALGTVIGHELAHGFGLLGNLVLETVSHANSTVENFFEAARCLIEDCNDIGIKNSINMDCNETFEENFADYVGIDLSYEAYMKLEENYGKECSLPGLPYTPKQLFWMIYSSIMCNNIDVDHTKGFIHMLPFQRILGSFRNSEFFAKDFTCPVRSNMNPAQKCKIL